MTERLDITGMPIHRRRFLAGVAAAGGLTAIGIQPAWSAAKRGGRLIIAEAGGASTDSLDPRTLTSRYHALIGFSFGNCLTEIGRDNELLGELATSWDSSPDAVNWSFELRQGVEFHNGKTMTSEDVVYSLNLHRGEDSKSGAKGLMDGIADIRADGPNRIAVTMKTANADVPYLMSDFHLIIVPAGTTDFEAGIGTGAFKLKSFSPGEQWVGMRHPNFWKEDRGHLDEVEIAAISDNAARLNGLMTGELGIIGRLDTTTASLLASNPDVTVHDSPGPGHRPLLMLCDRSPFDNADLRMAMKLAVDREQILSNVLNGYGSIANDHPIPPFDPFYAADIPQRQYDPEKAAFHYKKSGHTGALKLHASEATHAGAIDQAALIRETAAKAGIAIDIAREPADGFWSNVWMKVELMIGAWGGRPTADIMLSTAYKSDASWNDTAWRRPQFDELLLGARGEPDFTKRKQMYHDLQVMIHEDGGACIPFFINNLYASRSNVMGLFPSGAFSISGTRAAERAWLAS